MRDITVALAFMGLVGFANSGYTQESDKVLVTSGYVLSFNKPIVISNTSNETDYVSSLVSKGSRHFNKKVSYRNNLLVSTIEKVESVSAKLTIKESFICNASAEVSGRTKLVAGSDRSTRYTVLSKTRSAYTLAKEGSSRNSFKIECKIQTEVVDVNDLRVIPNKSGLRKQEAARLKAMYSHKNPLNIFSSSIEKLIHAKIVSPVIQPMGKMKTKNIGFDPSDSEVIDETEMSADELRLENEYQKSLSI